MTSDSDSVYLNLISILDSVKLCFGPTEVQGTLRRRPWIRDFMRDYLKSQLDKQERIYYNSISEKP